jgi:hypothetical protein
MPVTKAHLPPYPDSDVDCDIGPDREATTGAPRWVKVFGAIAVVVVVLVVVVLLIGGGPGGHGPGRHTGGQTPPFNVAASAGADGQTPSSVTSSGGVGGHKPLAGRHVP